MFPFLWIKDNNDNDCGTSKMAITTARSAVVLPLSPQSLHFYLLSANKYWRKTSPVGKFHAFHVSNVKMMIEG